MISLWQQIGYGIPGEPPHAMQKTMDVKSHGRAGNLPAYHWDSIELVSLGVGGTVGSGIFVVPGIAAKLSGPGSLIAWVIVALSASCVLLSLASYVSYRFT